MPLRTSHLLLVNAEDVNLLGKKGVTNRDTKLH